MKNGGMVDAVKDDFAFEVGQCFRSGKTVFKIIGEHGPYLKLEHAVSLESKFIEMKELVKEYRAREIVPCTEGDVVRALRDDGFLEDDQPAVIKDETSTLSNAAKEAGRVALKYITQLREYGYSCLRPTPLLELDVERLRKKFGDSKAPRPSTLYRISLDIERLGGDKRAAYPKFSERGGGGKSRMHPVARKAYEDSVEILKRNPKARIAYTKLSHDIWSRLLAQEGQAKAILLQPSQSTITREVKKTFSAYEISLRNEGKKAADKKFASWTPRDKATAPLEVVEFDDKDSRVFGIDERTGLPVGRLFITTGVDQCTAIPMGFSISDQPRNTWSAINAFVNCVLPKDLSHPDYSELRSDVPYMGKMGIAIFDNALYNHSKMLQDAANDISKSMVAFAKPYTPREKSRVEDFNGRMATDFFSGLPGFLGPKDSRDFLVQGVAAANMSVAEFRRRFLNWAYNDYCNKPRANGMTPRQGWELGMLGRKPRIPGDVNSVLLAAMLRHKLRLRPELIQFTGLIYQNQRLEIMRRKIGHNAEVELRYHPEHLERIFVFDKLEKEWFSVPSANPEYTTNLSLYQHVLIRKKARDAGAKNPTIPALLTHREELAKLVSQSRNSKKLKERKWAKRVMGERGFPISESAPLTIVMTDLEAQVAEIEAVEMDNGVDEWEFPAA
jgi:putative transposase